MINRTWLRVPEPSFQGLVHALRKEEGCELMLREG
jgi:hypothetical protein